MKILQMMTFRSSPPEFPSWQFGEGFKTELRFSCWEIKLTEMTWINETEHTTTENFNLITWTVKRSLWATWLKDLLLLLTLPLCHVPRCLLRPQLWQRRHQSRRAVSGIWSEQQGEAVLDRQEQVGRISCLNGIRWLIRPAEMKRGGFVCRRWFDASCRPRWWQTDELKCCLTPGDAQQRSVFPPVSSSFVSPRQLGRGLGQKRLHPDGT